MTMVQPPGSSLDRRKTYSYRTGRYAERSGQTYAAFFTRGIQPKMTLLDCGCGPGTITVDLAAQVAPGNILCIDVDESALAKARELQRAGLDQCPSPMAEEGLLAYRLEGIVTVQ